MPQVFKFTFHPPKSLSSKSLSNNSYYVCVCACVCVCAHACVLGAQSCPTLCNPMDRSPPGSSVHGILQAKILEWVAISFSSTKCE